MVPIEKQAAHWDKTWNGRIRPNGVEMNNDKVNVIMEFLWCQPVYFNKPKLEIGCGPAVHSRIMSKRIIGWEETWTGLDLSQVAVDSARAEGLNARYADFIQWRCAEKFDVFMFWDALEHFEDIGPVADKVKRLSIDGLPYVLGNIPLYISPHDEEKGGVECPVNINDLRAFLTRCGCTDIWHRVYGIRGLPYMIFEGCNAEKKQEDMAKCFM